MVASCCASWCAWCAMRCRLKGQLLSFKYRPDLPPGKSFVVITRRPRLCRPAAAAHPTSGGLRKFTKAWATCCGASAGGAGQSLCACLCDSALSDCASNACALASVRSCWHVRGVLRYASQMRPCRCFDSLPKHGMESPAAGSCGVMRLRCAIAAGISCSQVYLLLPCCTWGSQSSSKSSAQHTFACAGVEAVV